MKIGYYAIIPAFIRYDKDLTANTKLLYGEITALCNEKGYCWASNKYFCELYNISDRTFQRILKQLIEKKYINIVIDNGVGRKIYLTDTPDKNDGGLPSKLSHTPDKNVGNNNKNNIIKEIKERESDFFDYDWLNS